MKSNAPKQRRGRYGILGSSNKSGDFNRYLFLAKTHDYVLFFTNKGQAYMLRGYQIPEASRTAKGTAAVNLLPLRPDEKITAVINVPDFDDAKYLFMATNRGTVKRCRLTDFSSVRKNGLKAIALHDGEELIGVKVTDGNNSILLATNHGMAIRFDEQDVRCMSRTAHGVKGINLYKDDCVVAMDVVRDDSGDVLLITEKGIGKRTRISEFKTQKRGRRGMVCCKPDERSGLVAGMCMAHPDDMLFLFSAKGYVLCVDVNEIRCLKRFARGVIVMRLHEGDVVTAICRGS